MCVDCLQFWEEKLLIFDPADVTLQPPDVCWCRPRLKNDLDIVINRKNARVRTTLVRATNCVHLHKSHHRKRL